MWQNSSTSLFLVGVAYVSELGQDVFIRLTHLDHEGYRGEQDTMVSIRQ